MSKALAEKQPILDNGSRVVRLETNIRKIDLAPSQQLFQYSVSITFVFRKFDGNDFRLVISNSKKKCEEHEQDKERCKEIYRHAVERFADLRDGGPYFYDCQSTLWAFSKIESESLSFTINEGVCSRHDFIRAEFVLAPVKNPEISTNDVSLTVNSCPDLVDRRLLDALGTIISEGPNTNEEVITIGGSYHYLINSENVGIRTIWFREGNLKSFIGATKSIKTLEGDGTPALFMTTEMKCSLFHPDYQPLLEVLETFNGFNLNLRSDTEVGKHITEAMKGVFVLLNYGRFEGLGKDGFLIKITGFGLPPHEQTFEKDGERISVYDHFLSKYDIRIRFEGLMTVETTSSWGEKSYFPPELLCTYTSQKVTQQRMVNSEPRELNRLAAGPPSMRKEITERMTEGVGLLEERVDSISISDPTSANGKVLEMAPRRDGGRGSFYEPMKLHNWVIIFVENEFLRGIESALVGEMMRCGMEVSPPAIDFMTENDIHSVFLRAKERQVQLMIFITRKYHDAHDFIKAGEQKYDVLTQEVHLETAEQVMGGRKRETLKGIIHKTNIKLGGLNYLVQSNVVQDNMLIIGFGLSNCSSGFNTDEVMSVGYAANTADSAHKFIGGYLYVKKNKDLYGGILPMILKKSLKAAKANRVKPEKVVIFFHGISDSQFGLVNEEYHQKCIQCFESLRSTYQPELTLIVSTRNHSERFYLNSQGQIRNLQPGTVVDTGLVSPVYNQFYHAGAFAVQGTTKTTKYTIVSSTKVVDMNEVEAIVNDLCQDYQIVSTPTSIPAPLYIASSSAERGNKILKINGGPIYTENKVDFESTNRAYGYHDKIVSKTRFNA